MSHRLVFDTILPNIAIGKSNKICANAFFSLRWGGLIEIGNNNFIDNYALIRPYGGKVKIGNYCSINAHSFLHGGGGIEIGDYVRIAPYVSIISENHLFLNAKTKICDQGLSQQGIVIEDDVWIGTGAKILDGVTIRQGSVIGAGAIVTRDTEQFGVYVGSPARLIKKRQ